MVLLRPYPPQPPGPTLNAITPIPADRAAHQARRLATCQRLAELGMELAEATQRAALRDLQPRVEHRLPSIPGLPQMPSPPAYHSTALGELFATLSRCVRQALLLEARLEAGAFYPPPPPRATPAEATPGTPAPSRASCPDDSTRLHYERLEDDLAADAGRAPSEILAGICQQLGQASEHLPAPSPPRAAPGPRQAAPAPKPRQPPKPIPPPESASRPNRGEPLPSRRV